MSLKDEFPPAFGKLIEPERHCMICGVSARELEEINHLTDDDAELGTVRFKGKTELICTRCRFELCNEAGSKMFTGDVSLPKLTTKFRDYVVEEVTKTRKDQVAGLKVMIEFANKVRPIIRKYQNNNQLERIDMYIDVKLAVTKWNDEHPDKVVTFDFIRTEPSRDSDNPFTLPTPSMYVVTFNVMIGDRYNNQLVFRVPECTDLGNLLGFPKKK